jgi:hypothetical protein
MPHGGRHCRGDYHGRCSLEERVDVIDGMGKDDVAICGARWGTHKVYLGSAPVG